MHRHLGGLLDTDAVDHILTEGDRMLMHLNALENESIPNAEALSLRYLPIQGRWTV